MQKSQDSARPRDRETAGPTVWMLTPLWKPVHSHASQPHPPPGSPSCPLFFFKDTSIIQSAVIQIWDPILKRMFCVWGHLNKFSIKYVDCLSHFEPLNIFFTFTIIPSIGYWWLQLNPSRMTQWEFAWDKRLSSKQLESQRNRGGVFLVALFQGICLLALGFLEIFT